MSRCRLLLVICLLATNLAVRADACPFCSAVSQTLTQEIEASDVSVVARLIKLPTDGGLDAEAPLELDLDDPDSGTAEFEVVEVIRGENAPAVGSVIKVVYFGGNEQKKNFLINGLTSTRLDWSTPLPLTDRGVDYIRSLSTLPKEGADRLAFFLNHLEDEDPLLAQDAYDEFGRSPYEVVIAVGDRMDRQQLIGWIEDPQVGPTRRRLYLTMLGICGQPEDIAILESLLLYDYQQLKPGLAASFATMAQAGPVAGVTVLSEMVKADVRRKQQCLDALIAAYLKLKGPSGLPLIEERFLTNPAAEYTHVYAAVMALRFHGEETDELPKDRLLETVRLVLDNPEIADQVIPDLARWEDWSVMDKLVNKFKTSEENAWIRQPVISYLLAASEQPPEISDRANAALAELEELDPKGVKQARSYMAFGLLARSRSKKDKKPQESGQSTAASKNAAAAIDPNANSESAAAPAQLAKNQPQETPSVLPVSAVSPPGPSRLVIIGGPLVAGLFLFCVFAILLRGTDLRSTSNES
ncbi:MAG: hypothetical protein AAGD11_04735 [Planctomycetota bacterium]